jgi:hypothetical protein
MKNVRLFGFVLRLACRAPHVALVGFVGRSVGDAVAVVVRRAAPSLGLAFCLLWGIAGIGAGAAAAETGGRFFTAATPFNLRAAHSGRCLDVINGPTNVANGAAIQQYDCLGAAQSNQMWTFSPAGDGSTYYVRALSSGKCLDVVGGAGAVADGTPLQQWDCLGYGQANQRWKVISAGDPTSFYVKSALSGKCLDVRGGPAATANSALLQQWEGLGYAAANQRWYFTRGDAVPVTPDLDGDGSDFAKDCNDADPDIHPGATDLADNGVDEDCSGTDATMPVNSQPPSQTPPPPGQTSPPWQTPQGPSTTPASTPGTAFG